MILFLIHLLNFQFKMGNSDGRTVFTVLIVILVLKVALLLYAYIQRTKRNQMLENCEQMRSNYFSQITHEFRTPLTIILGMSKQLREQKDLSHNNSLTYLTAIERQGRNLSDLVNQLLDVVNLPVASKTMQWKTGDIIGFVEMVTETFSIYAKQKEIELIFFTDEKEIISDFVPDYLSKILQNLLSNAIKYSSEDSKIFLILEKTNKKKLLIKVVDQGEGIDKADLPHIFELFYKGRAKNDQTGNGIGLSLTKQLIEMLNGKIHVESDEEKGSTFTVELPLLRNEKQLYSFWLPDKNNHLQLLKKMLLTEKEDLSSSISIENDPRTTILLVEDNKDVAHYIRSMFKEEQYKILYTNNGVQALEMANEHMPDIVITDIIIPKKNGIELCKEMKASFLLNHIPVIIISAKDKKTDVLEGLKNGADGYLEKPFYAEELQVRVVNLLESRHLLKEKYRRTVLKDEKTESNGNMNVEFLRHVTDIIYREMKNAEFSPKKLAEELAISMSQLNKKLNATTGYPSSTYILQVKLTHAKKILGSQNKTIGEVAAECGIYDINYFSRIFKKQTGVTPTQYKRLPPK